MGQIQTLAIFLTTIQVCKFYIIFIIKLKISFLSSDHVGPSTIFIIGFNIQFIEYGHNNIPMDAIQNNCMSNIKYQMLVNTLKCKGWLVHLTTSVVEVGGDTTQT